jgi:hypothetical protein
VLKHVLLLGKSPAPAQCTPCLRSLPGGIGTLESLWQSAGVPTFPSSGEGRKMGGHQGASSCHAERQRPFPGSGSPGVSLDFPSAGEAGALPVGPCWVQCALFSMSSVMKSPMCPLPYGATLAASIPFYTLMGREVSCPYHSRASCCSDGHGATARNFGIFLLVPPCVCLESRQQLATVQLRFFLRNLYIRALSLSLSLPLSLKFELRALDLLGRHSVI